MSPSSSHFSMPPAAIAPHLLHSPTHSPRIDLNHFMNNCHDNPATSPDHSFRYPPSPQNDVKVPMVEPPIAASVISPGRMLVVQSYGPASAPQGSDLTVLVDFTNLSSSTDVRLRIVFGDLALPTSVAPNVPLGERQLGQERGDWSLKIVVPPMVDVSEHVAKVGADGCLEWPLTLQALDGTGNLLDMVGFGLFVYDNSSVPPKQSPPAPYTYRARSRSPGKRSRDSDDGYTSPSTKRLAFGNDVMHLRPMVDPAVHDSFLGTRQTPPSHRVPLQHINSLPLQNFSASLSVTPNTFQQHSHVQGSSHSQFQSQVLSQGMSEVFTVPSSPGAHSDDSPALIRTSQLGHDARPEQASVAIQGDLETMKLSWLDGEVKSDRRLVQFWKQQVGTTLRISFAAIPQSEYKENTIVVSCIYRRDVDDFFITSVDVIYLLEALAGNRFEVEEKNRIRRNLEGFKPMTISKSKPGTEDFFRVIMEFPLPRPRNIEKDVKVFEWGKLKMMLEKVFSKYSTVPLPQSTPSPSFEVTPREPSAVLYSPPKCASGSSTEVFNLPGAANVLPGHYQKRRPLCPNLAVRLRDVRLQPPLQISSQNHRPYADQFVPPKFNGYDDSQMQVERSEYGYNEMHMFNMPLELEQGPVKTEPAYLNDRTAGVPEFTGGPHEGITPASPASSDNSPVSITLSVSSGTSSEGRLVESRASDDSERLPQLPY